MIFVGIVRKLIGLSHFLSVHEESSLIRVSTFVVDCAYLGNIFRKMFLYFPKERDGHPCCHLFLRCLGIYKKY